MKKLFTFLVLGAFAATSLAQSGDERIERSRDIILGKDRKTTETDRSRDVVLGRRTDDGIFGTSSSRNASEINREYDRKIREIRNNPNLTNAEKERIIRRMENERRERLRRLDNRDRDYRDRDDDYRNGKHKKSKSNNGKHLGWEKGKGNQMKNKNGRRH
jgi:hypothetical protein